MHTPQERRRIAEQCLPDAPYRAMLTALHDELLTALEQQEAEKPFHPDWANYQQGYENGKADALEQMEQTKKPVAYLTETEQGDMVWTPEMYSEACTYCDDGEFPVPLYKSAQPVAPAPQPAPKPT